MKLTKRSNLFETNSSSVHAICIGDEKPVIDSSLKFTLGEFGWEKGTLNSPYERASYLWTAICYYYKYDDNTEMIEEYKNKIFGILSENGVTDVEFENPSDAGYFYIDHVGTLDEWLKFVLGSDSNILSFLFSPDSIVVTGNDNGDYPDMDAIDKPADKIYVKYN